MTAEKFNKKFYTVYNVIKTEFKLDNLYPIKEVYELYSMLLNSQDVVTIENHKSDDTLRQELRVIFWSRKSYDSWATNNRQRYDELIASFNKIHSTGLIKFERYTSQDNYTSEFPYTIYPEKSSLIDWSLIPYYKNFIIKDLCPLGKMQEYLGDDKFAAAANIKEYGARFILERTSDIVRRPISQTASKNSNFPCKLIAYSFQQSINVFMYSAPWLYRKLTKLTFDVEKIASDYISDCDNAAVLIGHNSMGSNLTTHTHRLSDETRYTFTIIVRLTFEDKGAVAKFYDPLKDSDPNLPFYYNNPSLLIENLKNTLPKDFSIEYRASILLFSASYIPHLVQYDNDIYLFYVYDNVTFKPNMLEFLTSKSDLTLFSEDETDKRLFYQKNI